MTPDQIILEPPVDQTGATEPRSQFGEMVWYVLIFLFGLLFITALFGSLDSTESGHFVAFDSDLKGYVEESLTKPGTLGPGFAYRDSPKEKLSRLEKKIAPERDQDELAQALYAAVLTEEHKPVPSADLYLLKKSRKYEYRVLGQIYGSPTLTPRLAKKLVSDLPQDGPFVYTMAKVHALEKAGDKGARAKYLQGVDPLKLGLTGLIVLGVFAGCVFTWSTYLVSRREGQVQPLGLKSAHISLPTADRYAARGLQLLLSFLIIQQVSASIAGKTLSSPALTFLNGAIFIGLVLAIFRTKIFGKNLTLADIGLSKEGFGENVLWGVGGFLAELPIAMLLGWLGSTIFSFLPLPSHPATSELSTDHSFLTFASILFFGAVVAPFWEEIMFRGLLFPALTKLTRSPVWGVALSTLMFVSVHPQGIALYASLGAFAVMSCFLSYQRRSLVPCIVMHAMHNLTLLTLAYLR